MAQLIIQFPPEIEPDMTRLDWERQLLNPWRARMKRLVAARQGGLCARCGQPGIDLDEPIIPRCDMRGLSLEQRRLAFGSCNMEYACIACNRESAHDRLAAWERAVALFGLDAMRAWYMGIGLKAPDHRFIG